MSKTKFTPSNQHHSTLTGPTMFFIGVTTGQSASMRMFPQWAEILGLPEAQLLGVDLGAHAPKEAYRDVVWQMKTQPLARGALITVHKIDLLHAARDLFDELTADAQLCQEVSCIYKRNGRLFGHAVDPTTAGLAMEQFLPQDYWTSAEADVLCLGAGGAAVAIVTYLCTREETRGRPGRVTLVDRDARQLENVRELLSRLPASNIEFDLRHNGGPVVNDALIAQLPPRSLVINATGMGKDTPGSPISNHCQFPQNGFVWELNYRGELDFLKQAQKQAADRDLHLEDGWTYFLLSWSKIVGLVFDAAIDGSVIIKLAQAAKSAR